jgi:hypothetical protein
MTSSARFQGFEVSEFQGFEVSEFQGFKVSGGTVRARLKMRIYFETLKPCDFETFSVESNLDWLTSIQHESGKGWK